MSTSLPARGAWIEILTDREQTLLSDSRSLRGERGLKLDFVSGIVMAVKSLPARGAWIEIYFWRTRILFRLRRSLRGERGLKSLVFPLAPLRNHRRSLRGERGLKLENLINHNLSIVSLPARGAWIEIYFWRTRILFRLRRSLRGERGLKYHGKFFDNIILKSLPARGAWIEIK